MYSVDGSTSGGAYSKFVVSTVMNMIYGLLSIFLEFSCLATGFVTHLPLTRQMSKDLK